MRKIVVFTGTRAEYGLLYWLMKGIQSDVDLELQLIVSGMHLSAKFGDTYQQIEKDGFKADSKVDILLSSNTPVGIAKSMGLATIGFADALERLEPDILVVLGDRFEALSIAQTALVLRIPILHIHGGEVTEGAYDDAIRHAITKLSQVHCTSTEQYRQRVIQLGENPVNVSNVGAIGLDNLNRLDLLSVEKLSESLSFVINKPFFIFTYHPPTLGDEDVEKAFTSILESLDHFPDHQIIMTYPNADEGGRLIINMLEKYAAANIDRVLAIASLGQLRYLSAVKHAKAVIGNSSSGIIEAPSLGTPTVNIGDRQKGRLAAASVLHTGINSCDIISTIKEATSPKHIKLTSELKNPYGDGYTSFKIIDILKKMNLKTVKSFYDLRGE